MANINNRVRVDYRDMRKFLNYMGFEEVRHSNSTHVVFKNNKGISVPVPNKKGTMCQGTVSKILKQINSNRDELVFYLYRR
jgi:predicted RNA binding protein YcfA (HicA-like mRNA interferase family)